jgi:hypothetical protein
LRRSELQNIANGLLGTFVSRNNDIDGYWGLGMLRSFADSTGVQQLTIDLLETNAQPHVIESCKQRFRDWLRQALEKQSASVESLTTAQIKVSFFSTFESFPSLVKDTRGLPYECFVEIRVGTGTTSNATKLGVCAPNDPQVDRISARLSSDATDYRS